MEEQLAVVGRTGHGWALGEMGAGKGGPRTGRQQVSVMDRTWLQGQLSAWIRDTSWKANQKKKRPAVAAGMAVQKAQQLPLLSWPVYYL